MKKNVKLLQLKIIYDDIRLKNSVVSVNILNFRQHTINILTFIVQQEYQIFGHGFNILKCEHYPYYAPVKFCNKF